jgi:Flp pilus assembly protein TadG
VTASGGDDGGSVLMLVPAAVLVLLVLGAICVDSAVVFLAQRDLANRTAAAANDIAGFAVSDRDFYGEAGTVALDAEQAEAYARLAFAADRLPGGYHSWTADAVTDGDEVTVAAEATVGYVFAKAIPGAPDVATVRAHSVATVRRSAG